MQRPAAVEGDEIGDIDQRVDRPQSDCRQPLLQPVGRGAVLHALYQPQPEGRAQRRLHSIVTFTGQGKSALHRLYDAVLEGADGGGAEIAGDAVDAGAVGPVGREIDLDHRLAERGIVSVAFPDRRVGRQIDDAVMVVGELQLGFRHQHAAAFDAADGADGERDVLAGDEGAGRREHALHAGARVGRAAHDLDRLAVAGIDHADAQAVGVGMLLGGNDRGNHERLSTRLVLDALDLEPDHGELVDDRRQRSSVSRCSLSQQRELHDATRRAPAPACGGWLGSGRDRSVEFR